MLSSFRQNLLGCVRNSTRARKTSRETSTGTPRDTCTRGAVDHQILDVSYNIYKSKRPFGCFFNQNGEGRDCRFGAGHTTVKSISDEVLFCVVFPIPGTRASLTLNSPFTVFEKRGFQNPNSGGFSEPQKKHQRGPHEILVLVGR